jgi:hypothetical protein
MEPGTRLVLFPPKFRLWGLGIALAGVMLAILRFSFGFKPDVLNVKVFAIYSRYMETKVFEVIQNQLVEEISGILVMTGLTIAAFSRMKTENELVHALRLKSFLLSGYLNAVFFIGGLLLTYGLGYIFVLILNSVSWLVFYLAVFSWLYHRNIKTES